MSTAWLPADTSPSAWAIMLDRFTAMTIAQRAQAAQGLNDMCTEIAIAGIRHYHGDVSDDDLRWHLASRRYGRSVANEVYGARPT